MFSTAFDRVQALRVSRVSPPSDRSDIEALTRTLALFDEDTRILTVRTPVHLLLLESAVEATAADRRSLAEVARGLRAPRLLFALVTSSMVHRGALQAVTWLAPPPPGHQVAAFATLAEAQRWAEQQIGGPLLGLRALLTSVGLKSDEQ